MFPSSLHKKCMKEETRIFLGPPSETYLNIFTLFILVLSSIQAVKIYWKENCFLCLALKVGSKFFEVLLFCQLKQMHLY